MLQHFDRTFKIVGPREFFITVFRWSCFDIDSDADLERRIDAAIADNEVLTAHLHGQRPFIATGIPTKWEATSTGGPATFTVTMHRRPHTARATASGDLLIETPEDATRIAHALTDFTADKIGSRTCSECGPHGGKGKVLLLESWVDCLTCRPQRSIPITIITETP